jgi:DNA repair protein RadC
MNFENVLTLVTDGKPTKAATERVQKFVKSWTIAEAVYEYKHGRPTPLNKTEMDRLTRAHELHSKKITKFSKSGATPNDIYQSCRDISELSFEVLRIITLDSRNNIKHQFDFQGWASGVDIRIRQALIPVVKFDAERIVMVHNHPTGNPNPSDEDIHFTNVMKNACDMLGIIFCDHVIVSDHDFYSFRRENCYWDHD